MTAHQPSAVRAKSVVDGLGLQGLKEELSVRVLDAEALTMNVDGDDWMSDVHPKAIHCLVTIFKARK